MKEESEKFGLKLNIQKTKIMASGPITSWQIDGETMGTERDFIYIQDWLPLGLTSLISLQPKGLSRVFSNTTVQKHQFFGAQLSL